MGQIEQQHTPEPWGLEVGEQVCFHKGNHVAITKQWPPSWENGYEGTMENVAEVWPGVNDEADGRRIVECVNGYAALQARLDAMIWAAENVLRLDGFPQGPVLGVYATAWLTEAIEAAKAEGVEA
jgi:hypothetical protein